MRTKPTIRGIFFIFVRQAYLASQLTKQLAILAPLCYWTYLYTGFGPRGSPRVNPLSHSLLFFFDIEKTCETQRPKEIR